MDNNCPVYYAKNETISVLHLQKCYCTQFRNRNSKIGNQSAADFLLFAIDLSLENIPIIEEVIAYKQIASESIVVEVK